MPVKSKKQTKVQPKRSKRGGVLNKVPEPRANGWNYDGDRQYRFNEPSPVPVPGLQVMDDSPEINILEHL